MRPVRPMGWISGLVGYSSDVSEFGKTLGVMVRNFRMERRLSLTDLSRRSGVARATLVNLERGVGNPTISTVWALANSLGVAFSDLFERPSTVEQRLVRAKEGHHILSEGQAPRLDLRLVERLESPQVTEIFDMAIRPGVRHVGQSHGDGVVERLFLHSGRMLAGPVDDPVELEPADFLRYPVDREHVYAALDGPCRGLLLVQYPPVGRGWR